MSDLSPGFPFAIVGFDLDGTLLDTAGDLAAAANHALALAGRSPLPVGEVIARVGGGTRNMLTQVLAATGGADAALVDRLLPALLDYYEANMTVHTRPYAGTATVLDELRTKGVRLGVVTNKLEHLAVALLERTGLAERFECVIGGDTAGLANTKPAPDPILMLMARLGGGRTAFVGDSTFDVVAARAAGASTIACRFGFSGDGVDSLNADAVIDSFDALIPALARL